MFKRGQLVIVDVDKFYHFYKPKLSDSIYGDPYLKNWISRLNKVTNGTRVLRIESQEGDTALVKVLNGEYSWYLNNKVLIPYIEKTFYYLKYHL